MRACIYARISLDRSGEELGVTRQLEDCRELVSGLGWSVVGTYVDNDISATSGKPRPEYRRMLKAIEAGEIDVIVAWAPDRIYRRVSDLDELIGIIDKQSVAVRTVKAGEFDLSTGMGKMIARILGSVAQGEGDIKSERYKRSIRQRREAGTVPRSPQRLFGYTRDGEIDEAEAATIRWAAALLIDGVPANALAAQMNQLGIVTTRGNPWSRNTVRSLMSNGRLAGRSMHRGDVVGVGQWEPILDGATFEQVQAALAVQRRSAPQPRVALLAGLVRCSLCGHILATARMGRKSGQTERRRVYRCRKEPGAGGCGRIVVDAPSIEELVEEYARARLADPWVREELSRLSQTTGDKTAEILALEQRLTELESQLDEPGVPVATVMRAISRTRERIEALHYEVASTPPSAPLEGDWPQDLARRARLVRLVVESVTVAPASRGGNTFDPTRVEVHPRL